MNTHLRMPDAQRIRTTQKPINEPGPFSYDTLPDELRQYPNFVLWIVSKGKKIPFSPHIDPETRVNQPAKPDDPTTWGTYEDVTYVMGAGLKFKSTKGNFYRRYPDGIGFELTNTPFVGLDFDGCIGGEVIAPRVYEIAQLSYSEISQSGRGVKCLGRGDVIEALKTDDIEIYSKDRFFALTGRIVDGSPRQIHDLQSTVEGLLRHRRPNRKPSKAIHDSIITAAADDADLDWGFIGWLERNPNRLWHQSGLPHVARLNCPASQQLRDLLLNDTLPDALAAYNDSNSERRAVVAFTTQKLHMMPEERYVVLRTLTKQHVWDEHKKERDIEADYRRLIFVEYPVDPDTYAKISRSRYAAYCQSPLPIEIERPQPAPIERKPAHRPPGHKAHQIQRTHKMLQALANEDGVIHDITTTELADEYKKHYPTLRAISRSSMRDYLHAGRDTNLWVTEQENGNGRLVITLKQALFCHPKPTEAAPIGVTDASAELMIVMPQTSQDGLQCTKEVGEDTFVMSGGLVKVSAQPADGVDDPVPTAEVRESVQGHPNEQGVATKGDQYHTNVSSPQAAPMPILAELVRDAFASVAGSGRRITQSYVRRYVWMQDGGDMFTDMLIARQVTWERNRRAAEQSAATFDQLRTQARAMSAADVKRASRGAASSYVRAVKKGNPKAEYYRICAGIFAAEELHRVTLDEGELVLFAAADAALDELRCSTSTPARSGRYGSTCARRAARKDTAMASCGRKFTGITAHSRRWHEQGKAHYIPCCVSLFGGWLRSLVRRVFGLPFWKGLSWPSGQDRFRPFLTYPANGHLSGLPVPLPVSSAV